MPFNKVLLVNPKYSNSYFSIPVLPAGLGYLAQSLKNKSIEYQVFDMSLGYTQKDLEAKIRAFKPDLVAITCISYMLRNTYKLVSLIKSRFPSTKIVMGGPHVSSIKNKVLEDCPDLDYAVVGEGEESLVELCSGLEHSRIKGLIYRIGPKITYTGTREFLENLDTLAFPKYEEFELSRYGHGMIGIVTSRGCPYSCIYCSCNVIGKRIRFRTPEHIIAEIEYWYSKGFREFGIQEDNPTFDRERMIALCRLLKQGRFQGIRFMCGNGVRADKVDRELLQEMKDAGFKRLALGVESGSDRVLRSIKKGANAETMERAIRDASELGFFVSLFFLVGSPQETIDDVNKSIALATKYPVQSAEFFNLIPIPGSELYQWVTDNKYFVRNPQEYLNAPFHPARSVNPVFQTPEFPATARKKMLLRTKRVSNHIKRLTLESRFPKLGIAGKLLFFLYCTDLFNRLENKILCIGFLRNTIGFLREKIRNKFY